MDEKLIVKYANTILSDGASLTNEVIELENKYEIGCYGHTFKELFEHCTFHCLNLFFIQATKYITDDELGDIIITTFVKLSEEIHHTSDKKIIDDIFERWDEFLATFEKTDPNEKYIPYTKHYDKLYTINGEKYYDAFFSVAFYALFTFNATETFAFYDKILNPDYNENENKTTQKYSENIFTDEEHSKRTENVTMQNKCYESQIRSNKFKKIILLCSVLVFIVGFVVLSNATIENNLQAYVDKHIKILDSDIINIEINYFYGDVTATINYAAWTQDIELDIDEKQRLKNTVYRAGVPIRKYTLIRKLYN